MAHYLEAITGNRILIPELNQVMGALGAARIARDCATGRHRPRVVPWAEQANGVRSVKKSVAMRISADAAGIFVQSDAPLVWRNLFFPPEILNALGVRILTMETYAALHARSGARLRAMFDRAARKGFSAETCSFLRVLEGDDRLPRPDFVVGTSEPCQQGERVLGDLVRDLGCADRYHLLHTPIQQNNRSVETIAAGLEASVVHLEWSLGVKLDFGRLKEACALSNQARELAVAATICGLPAPP